MNPSLCASSLQPSSQGQQLAQILALGGSIPAKKRIRKANWTEEETVLLLQLYKENTYVLKPNPYKIITNKTKTGTWELITRSLNETFPGCIRTKKEVMKRWPTVLARSKARINQHKKNDSAADPQCPPPRLDKVDLLVAEIMGVNISSCLDLAGTQNSFDHALRDISSDGAGYSETEEATETRSEGGDFSEEEKEESLDYDARLSEAEDTTESHSDGPRLSEAEETTESRYDGAKPNEAEKTKESCSDGVRYSEAEKTNESHNDGVRFSETVKTKESHSDGFKVSEEKIREKCQSYTASEQLLPQQNPIVSAPSVKAVNINDEEDMNYSSKKRKKELQVLALQARVAFARERAEIAREKKELQLVRTAVAEEKAAIATEKAMMQKLAYYELKIKTLTS